MFARGFSPFTGLTKWTGLDTSRHGFTKFGAFSGAFVFTAPNVGNFLTASAIGNCETSVYVVLVSRMSLCRMIANVSIMARIVALSGKGRWPQALNIFTKSESWCVPRCVRAGFSLFLLVLSLDSNPNWGATVSTRLPKLA